MTTKRILAGVALAAVTAITLVACAPAGDTMSGDVDAATATDLSAFGDLAGLEAAAKAEGALNVIALPRDWANYGAVIDAFAAKYPETARNSGIAMRKASGRVS